jgi:hypothetical protein
MRCYGVVVVLLLLLAVVVITPPVINVVVVTLLIVALWCCCSRGAGAVQRIMCKHGPLECHSFRHIAMELVRACGDPRGRGLV